MFWYIGRKGPVRSGDIYRTIAPAACAAVCTLGVLVLSRPWLNVFQILATRLVLALGLAIGVSILVLTVIPAGRLAMQNFKQMLLLLVKRRADLPVQVIPEA
jgi:PST family polysaccharide transporter